MRHLLLAICGVVAVPALAAADGFAWHAPAGCPRAEVVHAKIAKRLDARTEVGAISVEVERAATGFVATIDTRAISVAGHARTLTASDCDSLADAVAIVVARLANEAAPKPKQPSSTQIKQPAASSTQIKQPARAASWAQRLPEPASARSAKSDPAADIDAAAIEIEPASTEPSFLPPAVRPERIAGATKQARLEERWNGGARLLALTGIGITPKVGYGGELATFLRHRDVFGELGYARWAERPTYVLPQSTAHVDVGVTLLALRGGWASDHMPLRGWLGVEVGSMKGIGVMTSDPDQGSGRWAAFAAGFGVGWPMSPRTRLVGTFEVAAPVERAKFTLANGTEIYQPAPASARAAFGLEVGWR